MDFMGCKILLVEVMSFRCGGGRLKISKTWQPCPAVCCQRERGGEVKRKVSFYCPPPFHPF